MFVECSGATASNAAALGSWPRAARAGDRPAAQTAHTQKGTSYLLIFLSSSLLSMPFYAFLCLSCIHILYILQKLSVSIWCFVCAFLVCILEKRSVSIYMVLCNRSKNHLWSVSHVFLTTNNLVVLLLFLHSSFGIDLGFLCSFACIYLSIYTYMCSCQHQYRYHFVLWLAMQR